MGHRVAVLSGGKLQQCASPRELYDNPVNQFVAGFIGSPAMNLQTAPLTDGGATLAGAVIPLSAGVRAAAARDKLTELVIGVRPEHMHLADARPHRRAGGWPRRPGPTGAARHRTRRRGAAGGGARRRRAAARPAGRRRRPRGGQDRGPQVPGSRAAGRPPRAAGRRLRVPPGNGRPPRGLSRHRRVSRLRTPTPWIPITDSWRSHAGHRARPSRQLPGGAGAGSHARGRPDSGQGGCLRDLRHGHPHHGRRVPADPVPHHAGPRVRRHDRGRRRAMSRPDLPVGAKVAVDPSLYCGYCRRCRSGRDNLCENWAAIGDTVDGAFAEYVAVPAANAHLLPDGIDGQLGAMIEPLACAVHGLRQARRGVRRHGGADRRGDDGPAPAPAARARGSGPGHRRRPGTRPA